MLRALAHALGAGASIVLLSSSVASAQDAATSSDAVAPEVAAAPDPGADAAAETPASADPIVHAILVEAVAEYEAGHYAEAQALFRRASELAPSGRTLRGLGMASYELRQYANAIAALEAARAATERPLTDTQRAHVADLLARARGFVAPVRFVLTPADATVRVDGVTTALAPDGTILLDPGRHLVVVDHDGYDDETLDVSLEPGVARELAIGLTPRVVAPAVPAQSSRDTVGWASAGLGIGAVLGVAASAVTGIVALSAQQELAGACTSFVCPESARAARDRAHDLSLATDVLGGGAAVLGAAALSLALAAALEGGGDTPATSVACGPTGCALTIGGRF